MKKLLFLLIMLPVMVSGQNLPNPGFEYWDIGNVIQRPQGWLTSNVLSVAQFGIYSAEPDNESFIQGFVSCKLSTYQEHPDSLAYAAFLTNGQPQIDYETYTIDFITGGTPFPYKPAKMFGFYKYTSNSVIEDFAQARVILKKYNEATGKPDTIGLGENVLLNPAADFTLFEVPITYLVSNVMPDSIVVIFHTSYPNSSNAGAELWLDSLHFDLSTSATEIPDAAHFSVSPNPASDFLNVQINTPEADYLRFYSSRGELIYFQKLASNTQNLEIKVSDLPPGIYFLSLFDKMKQGIQTKKIIIQ